MIEKRDSNIENVVLVGVITKEQDEEKSKEYLDELEFLTFTAGGEVVKRFVQKVEYPNPKTFIGSGKLEEVKTFIKEKEVKTVIFDDELNPAQLRNIEKLLVKFLTEPTSYSIYLRNEPKHLMPELR
jgi:GTP-binding protein HflX